MELLKSVADVFNYWIYIVIMMLGLYAMVAKNNLVKKLIGMSIFQTAIILFYVSISYKEGATIPILDYHQAHGGHHEEAYEDAHHDEEHADHEAMEAVQDIESPTEHPDSETGDHGHPSSSINPDNFDNPLPHVLMLTAIVVGVATLGVGLAITQKLYREFGSIEESEIIEQIRSGK